MSVIFDAAELGFHAREYLDEHNISSSLQAWPTSNDQDSASVGTSASSESDVISSSTPLCDVIRELGEDLLEGWQLDDSLSQEADIALEKQDERWIIDESTARLLATVLADPSPDPVTGCCATSWREIMTELPILEHNHEAYMHDLWHRNMTGFQPEMDARLFTDGPPDYAWTSHELDNKAKLDDYLDHEKLDISAATMVVLRSVFESCREQHTFLDPPTPNLSSYQSIRGMSPLLDVQVLPELHSDRPVAEINLSSNGSYSEGNIATRVAQMVAVPPSPTAEQLEYDLDVPEEASPYFSPAASKSLRVTTPLLPPSDVTSHEANLAEEISRLGEVFSSNTISDNDHGFKQFTELAQPKVDRILHQLAQEQLNELDTTLRLPLPELKDDLVSDTWQSYLVENPSWLEYTTAQERRWKGVSKLEKYLHWTPFELSRGKINLSEELEAVDSSAYLEMSIPRWLCQEELVIARPRGPLDITMDIEPISESAFVSRGGAPPPMQQLRNDNIEAPTLRPVASEHISHSVLHDIRVEAPWQVGAPDKQTTRTRKRQASAVEGRPSLADLVRKRACLESNNTSAPSLLDGGLDHFLQLNKAISVLRPLEVTTKQTVEGFSGAKALESHAPCTVAAVCLPVQWPALPALELQSYHLVLTPQTIARVDLIRGLERCLPQLHMIERDVLRVASTGTQQHEADITISPTTGLVLTTLQKLKQRPLPGQASDLTCRAKIGEMAPRYSRLIVLVSQSASARQQTLQDEDCAAIADFVGWTCAIDTSFSVVYVDGGEAELASWISGYIQLAAPSGQELAVEESQSEHVLRSCGLNAFAAQAILRACSAENGVQTTAGLARLMVMPARERRLRCSVLLGGDHMVDKLTRSVEAAWFRDEDLYLPQSPDRHGRQLSHR